MPDLQSVIADPKFHALPEGERMKVLSAIDPHYAGMDPGEQLKVVQALAPPDTSGRVAQPSENFTPGGLVQQAGTVIGEHAKEIGGAAKRVAATSLVPPFARGELPTKTQAFSDIGTLGSAAFAPGITLGGIAAEAGGRALGLPGGPSRFVGEMATGIPAIAKHGTVAGLDAEGQRAAQALQEVPGQTAATAGRTLMQEIPPLAKASRGRVGSVFQYVTSAAIQQKVMIPNGTPGFDDMVHVAQQAKDLLPNVSGPGKRVIARIIKAGKPVTTGGAATNLPGGLETGVTAATSAAPGIRFKDAERLHRMLSTSVGDPMSAALSANVQPRVLNALRTTIRNAQEAALAPFPDAQQAFANARTAWRTETAPLNTMERKLIGTEADPAQVLQNFRGTSRNKAARMQAAIDAIGANTPQAAVMRSGRFADATAGKSPGQIAQWWSRLTPEVQRTMTGDNPQRVTDMMRTLSRIDVGQKRSAHTLGHAVMTAGITGGAFSLFRYAENGQLTTQDLAPIVGITVGLGMGVGGASKTWSLLRKALHTPAGTREAERLMPLLARESAKLNDWYSGAAGE